MCDNWLYITLITKVENRKWFNLTMEVAVAYCRSKPYMYGLVYMPVCVKYSMHDVMSRFTHTI